MRTVVGVLRGGPSREYEVSLKTGASVLDALDKERYEPRDIFISKNSEWHAHGVAMEPEKALAGVDVAFNAMHGEFGEDGRVQRQLDALGMPYTGSDAFASALAFNKAHTKDAVRKLGVKVAHSLVLEPAAEGEIDALAQKLFRSFPHPAIVKPVAGGSSIGTHVAHTYHGLEHALRQAYATSPRILIEEYIVGKDVSVGVLQNFRGEDTYALIPTPNVFSHQEKDVLTTLAKTVHQGLGLMHYSDSDFVVSKRGIYFLEINSNSKLHQESKFRNALATVGASLSQFLDHVINLANGREKLSKKKCVPCEGGIKPLNPDQAEVLMAELSPEWMLIDQHRMLARTFVFKDFKESLEFANSVGAIAEEEGHHPDLTVGYGNVGVELTTHAIGGLSENDFIVAAKIDELKK